MSALLVPMVMIPHYAVCQVWVSPVPRGWRVFMAHVLLGASELSDNKMDMFPIPSVIGRFLSASLQHPAYEVHPTARLPPIPSGGKRTG